MVEEGLGGGGYFPRRRGDAEVCPLWREIEIDR